jgi:molecular chaperone IbpA
MRNNVDFAPCYRFGVGFDRLFDVLENSQRLNGNGAWPTYDIARSGENIYRISMCVPGFRMKDLEITQQPNVLVVTGKASSDDKVEYLHRGIDNRSFTRRFDLADYVEVSGASLSDGILSIELKREVPEAMKPRKIEIATASAMDDQKQISHAA